MVEILALLALTRIIGDMARRRGRSASGFQLMLLVFWFGGEILGAALTYALVADSQQGKVNLVPIYCYALVGAVAGAVLAFVVAKMAKPVDGRWIDVQDDESRRSRLKGAIIGGLAGGVFGALVVKFLYGDDPGAEEMSLMLQGFLAVGLVGALLGLVSGLQKE
jgi:hypothetical protein